MSRALPLDFTARPDRPPFWAWLLLAVGGVCALMAAQAYLAAEAARVEARSRLAAQEQAVRPKPNKPTRPDARAEARQRLEQAARHQLDLPWAGLVDSLQRTRPADVAFLAVNADGRRGDFQINAEARDHEEMLDYLRRLQSAEGLRDVVLTQHERVDSDGMAAVRFTLHGTWSRPGGPAGEAAQVAQATEAGS